MRNECPFGVEARFCEYQETFAASMSDAMRGELDFYCKLDKLEDCPKLKEVKDAVTKPNKKGS